MPIQTTKTITDAQGNTYPYLLVNLAISPLEKPTDVGGSVALRLTPYRQAEDGSIVKLESAAQGVAYLDVYQEAADDPILAQVVTNIMGSIQVFINDKGL